MTRAGLSHRNINIEASNSSILLMSQLRTPTGILSFLRTGVVRTPEHIQNYTNYRYLVWKTDHHVTSIIYGCIKRKANATVVLKPNEDLDLKVP